MKIFTLLLILLSVSFAYGIKLPKGVTMDSVACSFAPGRFSYSFLKNNEMVGQIMPGTCHYNDREDGKIDQNYIAEFYSLTKKDTFPTKREAFAWFISSMENYYKPVEITKWQKLKVQLLEVSLKYPWDWTYRLDKFQGIFGSQIQSENKLTLMITDQRGHSEILMLIRTPNTAKLTIAQVMETASKMNRAINFQNNPASDIEIGGKTFKSSENTFMLLMHQWHFWYADDQEIIYINYNLLKDEKDRYPEVMKEIVRSINWQ